MSPIVARSVASLYGCKPNRKNDMLSKGLLCKSFDDRPIAETTGIMLVCFDGKYTCAYEKILKI